MSDMNVITTDRLGKKYRRDKLAGPDNFREALVKFIKSPWQLFKPGRRTAGLPADRDLWAIREVDLQVKAGEILGIIGKNGAGKSTLLKVLSRVTPASQGSAVIRGRITSLLEIGIGFHPDLTGRENVFLNAALLGMKRTAVRERFDQIVAFAGIGDFIDTQVKKYSSGMFVRLAFSIAAHLDSEIVFIDEVLAVGDTDFQKKCIVKIQSVANGGRTVLFVSHNLAAIERLCNRCIVFDHGRIVFDGKTGAALDYYRSNILEKVDRQGNLEVERENRPGDGRARFQFLEIRGGKDDRDSCGVYSGGSVTFKIAIKLTAKIAEPRIAIVIKDQSGQVVLRLYTRDSRFYLPDQEHDFRLECRVAELPLTARRYQVDLWLNAGGQTIDYAESAAILTVNPDSGQIADPGYGGIVTVKSAWNYTN